MNNLAAWTESGQYVTLGVENEIFAIDVEHVHEILDVRPVTRVPNAPDYMLGMIDVRRRTVPVIDLRVKLGLPATAATPSTRIVVLDVVIGRKALAMGLLADRVYEVASLSEHTLEPPPDIGIRWRSDYIKGVGRRGEAFVIVLDMPKLFAGEETALIGGTVEA